LHRQEKLEFRRELLLSVQLVREVNPPNTAVGVNLHAESLDVVGACKPRVASLVQALLASIGSTHCAHENGNCRQKYVDDVSALCGHSAVAYSNKYRRVEEALVKHCCNIKDNRLTQCGCNI
jgi:hypothetical protein